MRNWRRSDACSTATEASIANLHLFLIYCFALFHDWNLHDISNLNIKLQHISNLYCVTLVLCHYEVHCAAYFKMARRVKQRSKTQGWILNTGGYRGGYSTGIQGWIFDTGAYSGVYTGVDTGLYTGVDTRHTHLVRIDRLTPTSLLLGQELARWSSECHC